MRKIYKYILSKDLYNSGLSGSLKKFESKGKKSLPASVELEKAGRQVKFIEMKGNVQTSRRGLKQNKFAIKDDGSSKSKRHIISHTLKMNYNSKTIKNIFGRDLKMQTSWLKVYDIAMAEDLTWQKILFSYSARLLKFLLNLRSNTLPSPDNLSRWNKE